MNPQIIQNLHDVTLIVSSVTAVGLLLMLIYCLVQYLDTRYKSSLILLIIIFILLLISIFGIFGSCFIV